MRVVIATGGTGGHLVPALKLADELKKQGEEIVFLGSFKKNIDQMQKSGYRFENLEAEGFKRNGIKQKFWAGYLMIKASLASMEKLKNIKPDVVCGFGGYGAFPVVFASTILRFPTMIHEQNVSPGRANALLAKFVKKVAVSFPQSSKFFKKEKTVFTGCPCHTELPKLKRDEIYQKFGLKKDQLTILIFGGSQGSRRINEGFIGAAGLLKSRRNFQVIHIYGESDDQELKEKYVKLKIPAALFRYLEEMELAYYIADLVIARSGAVTVSEIANYQLPAILIPYPLAVGNHQKENAEILKNLNLAEIIDEDDLTSEKLAQLIEEKLNFRTKKREQFYAQHQVGITNASKRLAQEIERLAQ